MTVAAPQPPAINVKALSWTVGVHLLLLLLFFWLQYSLPIKPAVDLAPGMEVNLGTSENGSGTDQPMSKKDPSSYSAAVVYKNSSAKSAMPKDMMQSTNADPPVVDKIDSSKKKHQDNGPKELAHAAPPQPRALYQGAAPGDGGNKATDNKAGSGEGTTTGPGDMGVPGGTPGAGNYHGTPGSGGTIGHTLTGRDINPKKLEAEFHEGGTVVIHVTVDRDGNIVNKYVKSSPNTELTKIALDKLSKAHFSKSTSSEPQQFGDVTIVFKTR